MRRTRHALRTALGELVGEGAPVTMSAVAQRAGLSRQVLHTHYASVGHLASEVLVRRILEGTGNPEPADDASAVPALVEAVRRDGLAPFLRFIRADRDAFLALRTIAHGQSAAVLAQVFAGRFVERDRPADDAALFVAGGMTTLVEHWLHRPDAPSPDSQADRLDEFARAVLGPGR